MAAQKGELNSAKRPEVRAKISEALKGDRHPSRLYVEKWDALAEHMRSFNPKQVSKVERKVGEELALVGFTPQYKVDRWTFDFAHPEKELLVEVQGCWYHTCQECYTQVIPNSTQKATTANDARKLTRALELGWTVIFLWEHELNAYFQRKGT